MKPENFSETAKENTTSSMKWITDASIAILETQMKQMEFASNFYTKAFGQLNKNNWSYPFGKTEKIYELIQKNFESVSDISKSFLKIASEYVEQNGSLLFPKETIDTLVNFYNKQADVIIAFNQKYVDEVAKQFGAKPFSTLSTEKFKKDLDANMEASKNQLLGVIDSYKKIINPSFEANSRLFNEVNHQMKILINNNLKLWSELINAFDSAAQETHEKLKKNENGHHKHASKETEMN